MKNLKWSYFNRPGMGIPIIVAIDKILGYVIDPLVYIIFGYYPTMIIGTIISIIVGYIYIRQYDTHKQDWLLFEKLKSTRQFLVSEEKEIIYVLKNLPKIFGRIFLFIYSFVSNPGTTLLITRKGSYKYDGFGPWYMYMLFILSAIATNVVWTNAMYAIVLTWRAVLKL